MITKGWTLLFAGGQHIVTAEGVRAHNVAICDADYNPIRQPQVIDL